MILEIFLTIFGFIWLAIADTIRTRIQNIYLKIFVAIVAALCLAFSGTAIISAIQLSGWL
jgi:hypothetical protein